MKTPIEIIKDYINNKEGNEIISLDAKLSVSECQELMVEYAQEVLMNRIKEISKEVDSINTIPRLGGSTGDLMVPSNTGTDTVIDKDKVALFFSTTNTKLDISQDFDNKDIN